MKTLILILIIGFLHTILSAAEFEVISFKKDPSDLSARKFARKDINDEECALIKVRSDIQGLMFDSNMGVTGIIEYKDGEYWVYVSPYERLLEVFRSGFVKFVYPIPIVIKPSAVYIMDLRIKGDNNETTDNNTKEEAENTTINKQLPKEDCSGTFIDERDGQEYKMVKIGEQCWMAENINIGRITKDHFEVNNNGEIEKLCYDYNIQNCKEYGGLYTWKEAMWYKRKEDSQGICPNGWHIPTIDEWQILIDCCGGMDGAVKALKSEYGWYQNGNGTNEFMFNAIPGGKEFQYKYNGKGKTACYWSSTKRNVFKSWMVRLTYHDDEEWKATEELYHCLSVRCIKD